MEKTYFTMAAFHKYYAHLQLNKIVSAVELVQAASLTGIDGIDNMLTLIHRDIIKPVEPHQILHMAAELGLNTDNVNTFSAIDTLVRSINATARALNETLSDYLEKEG